MMKHLLSIVFLTGLLTSGFAQGSYNLCEVEDNSIKIDGVLNDMSWQDKEVSTSFIQTFPTDSLPAQRSTEVKMAFDQRNLYVAVRCFTPSDDYQVNTLIRDFSFPRTDAFAVFLSPRNDGTNALSFAVSPYGSQREGIVANGGLFGVTTAWDSKWNSAVLRDSLGWTAEMAIPFKNIRYDPRDTLWSINFARNDLQINERSTWSKVPVNFNVASVINYGKLLWKDPAPKTKANINLIPYASAGLKLDYDDPSNTEITNLSKVGLDAKIGVSQSLNLDVTINPDFSNVRVDQQVINLDRFSVFFPELRPFFTENSDLFSDFGFRRIRPFFSRNIGLSRGSPVNILGGLRLSGNVSDKTRIGLMTMQTEGTADERNLESENYTVAAFQQQVWNRSSIGAILVNKQAFDGARAIGGQRNTVAGLDFNLYSKNNYWRGKIFYHQSFEDGFEIDGGAQAVWLNYDDGKWQFAYNHEYVGSNYSAEVGFVPRTGYFRFEHFVVRNYFPKKKNPIVFNHTPKIYYSQYWNSDPTLEGFERFLSTDLNAWLGYEVTFMNTASLEFKVRELQTQLTQDFDLFGNGDPILADNYRYRDASVEWQTNRRKDFVFSGLVQGGQFYDGNRLSYRANLSYRGWRPWLVVDLNFRRDEIRFDEREDESPMLIGSNIAVSFSQKIQCNTFVQYNTQLDNFNVNTRFQWRYAPMSDLFFVYTDNYFDDFRAKNRALVLRLSYWW